MSSPIAQTNVSFSFTFDIAGQKVPLSSSEISDTLSKLHASPNPLDEIIKQGVAFNTPPGWSLTIHFDQLTSWLAEHDLELPSFVAEVIDTISITIFHIGVSTNGSFSFSFEVVFDPPLGKDLTQGIFDIENVGLSVSHSTGPS